MQVVTMEKALLALALATDGNMDIMRQFKEALTKAPDAVVEVRPSLLWFVGLMEQKMCRGDERRPPWDVEPMEDILAHMDEEQAELVSALVDAEITKDVFPAVLEAVDVANCAFAAADKLNGCPHGGRGKGAQ